METKKGIVQATRDNDMPAILRLWADHCEAKVVELVRALQDLHRLEAYWRKMPAEVRLVAEQWGQVTDSGGLWRSCDEPPDSPRLVQLRRQSDGNPVMYDVAYHSDAWRLDRTDEVVAKSRLLGWRELSENT